MNPRQNLLACHLLAKGGIPFTKDPPFFSFILMRDGKHFFLRSANDWQNWFNLSCLLRGIRLSEKQLSGGRTRLSSAFDQQLGRGTAVLPAPGG
jgi:hypothetical protein